MKPTLIALSLAAMFGIADAQVTGNASGYPITPVPFTSVTVNDAFWSPRLQASKEVTIPLAFSKCEESGRYTNFEVAARQLAGEDTHEIIPGGFPFDDTDVYKTIEGASYLLQTYPDRHLVAYIDSVLEIVAKAQEPDGYLYTPRTMNPSHPHSWAGSKRWEAVEAGSHEFYNLGHMLEAACAHYTATGKRNFLDIAIRYADCVIREIGTGEGQTLVVPGHQIAEMGLVKLYLVTGDRRYLDQAKYFLDYRGKTSRKDAYSQAHKPVIEQDEAVGHAVRAGYMYSGMADVAALTGDTAYINAIDRIWDNIVTRKFYVTGGVGARHGSEAFGDNYELPNASAYCETCAQIANVYTNYRLFLLHGESKYYDVLERTLYNALISGISMDGGAFFYPNPLSTASDANYARQPWFGCACCPSNVCRFIPSLPGYIYAVRDNSLFVNLYMGNRATLTVGRQKVTLAQQTLYPYNGDVALTVEKGKGRFSLCLRIPGWVRDQVVPSDLYSYADGKQLAYSVKVNGESVDSELRDGYFVIDRNWKKGDRVELHFDMQPRVVEARYEVYADRGRIAVERGPLVYCAEWADNEHEISSYILNRKPVFSEVPDYLIEVPADTRYSARVIALTTEAQTISTGADGRVAVKDARLTLIPYYAWDHRGQKGGMDVWLPVQFRLGQ
ncbi:MAG: glycoside hydrolase family 127 protein [Bacteroidales bacterium]|nr:glycoside hydrolase family 127 protein [Candidatus Liminaster caballi]